MAMLRSRGARRLTVSSPKRMTPLSTLSRPATMRRSVVLPQPDGPSRVTNCRLGKRRLTSFSTWTEPKDLLIPSRSTSMAGSALDGAGAEAGHEMALQRHEENRHGKGHEHAG